MVIIQQMIILFILMLAGYLCQRLGYMDENVSNKLSAIVVNIANPAVLISGCITEQRLTVNELVRVSEVVLLIFAVLIAIAQILPVILHIETDNIGIYRAMTGFSNMDLWEFLW